MPSNASRFFVLLFALCLVLQPPSSGQGIGGAIIGTVRDQSGAVVPAVLIQITNMDTGQKRSVSSDAEGRYQARELPPGTYEVRAELGGFNKVRIAGFRLGVGQFARQDITLQVAPVGEEIEVKAESQTALIESTTPTLSTSFSEKQIRELPILTRDLNNLALYAPGVFSVRAFSFANTFVPFAANGSRGRDNNFIIDSVDNNEPLFGGAAAQFTNTDLFAEYRILTSQYKAEYGRNSGSVVNIITERGGNQWRGSAFYFYQNGIFNARNNVERTAGLSGTTRFYEDQVGGTVGGPLKKESAWIFFSYQWDRARQDLSPAFPLLSTLPTSAGLTALQAFSARPTVAAMLAVPTVARLSGQTSPCGSATSGLPTSNPCTTGAVTSNSGVTPDFVCSTTPSAPSCIAFGSFLVPRAGLFDIHDHQASGRFDKRLTGRDDFYARYLLDDLNTPRTVGALPAEVAFRDFGLYPEWRAILKQRTQNLGLFWTHAWPTALHELRGSFTRVSSQTGAFNESRSVRETQPAATVFDSFAINAGAGGTPTATQNFFFAFPAAGSVLTLGRDTRPIRANTNIFQLQDNVSVSRSSHSVKFGANFVRTQSNIRQIPSDLGQYFYLSFEDFINNAPFFALQRFANLNGRGGNVLPLRELGQFYFFQDDYRVNSQLTVSLGLRYEYYGQVINKLPELNSAFGPKISSDKNNIAPRIGFAWSPEGRTVIRGGYGFYYNPTVYTIPLLAWRSGPISPFISRFFPSGVFPAAPFTSSQVTASDINFTAQETVASKFRTPYVQNYSMSVQRQFGRDFLLEVSYVGSKGTKLFQRIDSNPNQINPIASNPQGGGYSITFPAGCTATSTTACTTATVTQNSRINAARGQINTVTNGARSIYQALQVIGTQRISRERSWGALALSASYTWSHMIDNASEIFGPGIRLLNVVAGSSAQDVEALTPFPQNPNNSVRGERGNSSFDRRHRLAVSYLWLLPSPKDGAARAVFGKWQLNGFVSAQTGQPFTPINAFTGRCVDAFGDGIITNDRPDSGNPRAPANSVALINNTLCLDPLSPDVRIRTVANLAAFKIVPTAGPYITPAGLNADPSLVRFVQSPINRVGNLGRNVLTAPVLFNVDMAAFKNISIGERRTLQFRAEVYNLLNRSNPGDPNGNIFTTAAQPVPAIAFAPVGPSESPARVIGTIPENALDSIDPVTGQSLFLSRRFMNTSSRHFQFAIKLLF